MLKDLQGQGSFFFFFNARDGGAGQATAAGLHVAVQSSSNEVGVLITSRMKAWKKLEDPGCKSLLTVVDLLILN